MTSNLITTRLRRAVLLLLMFIPVLSIAQVTVPFKIENHSGLPDNQLFVAVVGEDLAEPSNHIWVDPATGAQLPMSPAYNTVQGPVYGGNQGPGQNGLYADCFRRLSEIANNTVMVPPIQGCRIFIAYEEQLYFYFFGASGAQRGYTSPNATDPTDPNQGIRYEIIELTNNQYGMFANTTRVDSYQYPIGMELFGSDGYYKKVGEIATHEEIVTAFQASVPVEFQKCLDPATGEITAPSKTPEFADGSVGSMPVPGPYVNYMKPYVDAVWSKYANEDLIFDAGDAGIWKGRVQGEQLVMVSQSPAFQGRQAIITRRPTTQEVFEGKGVLDNVVQDGTTDLLVQAQICAALNRHIIDINTPNPGLQDWSDASQYYQASPCNHYAKFWHQQGISVDQLSYGFAYDDVFEYSSSVHTPNPTQAIINIGPYDDDDTGTATPIPATIQAEAYTNMNGVQLEATTDDGGGENVGWIDAGDWLEYKINVPQAGNYTVEYRVASLDAGGVIEFFSNGSSKGTTSFNATGGWQNWTTASTTVSLSAGEQTVRLVSNNSGWNVNWIAFKTSGTPPQDGCNISVNADFSVEISEDSNNPTLTFAPKRSGVGSPTCILYYSTSANDPYPGYLVSANTPYQINAGAGQTIYFYYTYSLPEGGENNTLNNKKSFVVGNCNSSAIARQSSTTQEESIPENEFKQPVIYPNPAGNQLNVENLPAETREITIYDITGKKSLIVNDTKGTRATLDIRHLPKGLHFMKMQTINGTVTVPFIKE